MLNITVEIQTKVGLRNGKVELVDSLVVGYLIILI